MDDKKIVLNDEVLDEAEFKKKKGNLENKKGVDVIKIKENSYKSRIKG